MSSPYHGRHRHVAAHGRTTSRSSLVARAIRRPVVTSSFLLAVVATTAAGYQATDRPQTGQAAFTISTQAISQANELANNQIEDSARLASARNEANASLAAAQEKQRRDKLAAEAAAAKARKEATERAARAKERQALEAKRQALIENARQDPRAAARALLGEYGFDDSQWNCLDNLWQGESGWRYTAENPSSGAYGIPQSLPGSKMASVAPDWRTNPVTQIRWGLEYIRSSYGTPCGAWDFWQSRSPHWY